MGSFNLRRQEWGQEFSKYWDCGYRAAGTTVGANRGGVWEGVSPARSNETWLALVGLSGKCLQPVLSGKERFQDRSLKN